MLRSSGAPSKETDGNMRDYFYLIEVTQNNRHNVGEIVMPKFKIVKVHSFRIGDKRYAKGDVVELSEEDAERLRGADFLKPMEEHQSKPEKAHRKG
jgi:hypothetical protein